MKRDEINEALRKQALDYHEFPVPGKLSVTATKQLLNQSDLALAYSPGVAAACEAIVENPLNAFRFTARGNLVGVITNGTAVLGLGAIGPLAAKPVMEGKAVLFKKFAGIDVFDIEVEQRDPMKLVELIAALEPTFGAINLEDIKAPECFIVERELRRRMKIPVFHDDQHGTAIIVGAACLNGLQVVGKDIRKIKMVVSGAGAAALACVDLLLDLGLRYDWYGTPSEAANRFVVFDPSTVSLVHVGQSGGPSSVYNQSAKNFGPRAGLAWDVFGSGRTVVRSAYAIMGNQTILGLTGQLLSNPPYSLPVSFSPTAGVP